jgi:hypothetical protein
MAFFYLKKAIGDPDTCVCMERWDMAARRAKAKDSPFFANQKSGSANTREKLASSPLCPEEHLRYELNETPDKRLARQDLSLREQPLATRHSAALALCITR